MRYTTTRNTRRALSAGFTFTEALITLMILGVLMTVAVPNFASARETSRAKSCVENLLQIHMAEEQYAMDHHLQSGNAGPALPVLLGAGKYLHHMPVCPSGGMYEIHSVGMPPTCSFSANAKATNAPHILPE
jgi:prepilin-type N-terminal cleavage/methylation domain-containing protein